jgi:hypothetical protein
MSWTATRGCTCKREALCTLTKAEVLFSSPVRQTVTLTSQ